LKSIKTEPYGKYQIQRTKGVFPLLHIKKQGKFINKKVIILKEKEYTQIPYDTAVKKHFLSIRILSSLDSQCGEIIYQGTGDYQKKESPIPKPIKKITRGEQNKVLCFYSFKTNSPVEQEGNGKKQSKGKGVE
tara:strand:+ start:1081 stop:1479 length:399 start_codon:yes stop_codon:yes gene_type:complete